jgi:hypothetical protein
MARQGNELDRRLRREDLILSLLMLLFLGCICATLIMLFD